MLTYFATALLLDFLTSPLSRIPSMTKTADLTPAQLSSTPQSCDFNSSKWETAYLVEIWQIYSPQTLGCDLCVGIYARISGTSDCTVLLDMYLVS